MMNSIKSRTFIFKKVGLNLVDWLAQDLHILMIVWESYQAKRQDREIYHLDLNENQCEVEFKPQKGR